MAATSYVRGHPVRHTPAGWAYSDTGEPAPHEPGGAERPCASCGRAPTPDGYDACLGPLPFVSSACCGHGVVPPFMVADRPMDTGNARCASSHPHSSTAEGTDE